MSDEQRAFPGGRNQLASDRPGRARRSGVRGHGHPRLAGRTIRHEPFAPRVPGCHAGIPRLRGERFRAAPPT